VTFSLHEASLNNMQNIVPRKEVGLAVTLWIFRSNCNVSDLNFGWAVDILTGSSSIFSICPEKLRDKTLKYMEITSFQILTSPLFIVTLHIIQSYLKCAIEARK
jgi:hypothetical protein